MLCIPDKPIAMTEWTTSRRTDSESIYAIRSSPEEESIIEKSIECHNQHLVVTPRPQQQGKSIKTGRVRRHSFYEPRLDDIKEEGNQDSNNKEKDLAAVHRERAFNSGSYTRKSEGRQFRKKMFEKTLFTGRPRALTC